LGKAASKYRDEDQDFYPLKNVPHGPLQQALFPSPSASTSRRAFVYTPTGTRKTQKQNARYCIYNVLGAQMNRLEQPGHKNVIMGNMIADGKIKPFITVMTRKMI
jgi:enterochelin esterase-like enzyme